jgi:AmiR/NasT family two-component response regulator
MAFAPPPAPRRAAGGDTAIDPQRLLQILTTVELEALGAGRAEVHQAAGMVSVQLSVSVAEARLLLRKRAFAESRPLAALAADVVGRRVRFEA